MRSLLRYLFLNNWLRKLISVILAIIIWFAVDQSLLTTKVLTSVGVRIINVPEGQTMPGLQSNGLLNKRLTLSITGKKSQLEDLNSSDLEVVIDAANKPEEWVATVSKRNLVSLGPELSITQHITRVSHKNLILKLVPLSKERIPIFVTKPLGEAPRGYQFLDIWPYHLSTVVSGPEEVIKKLKARGIKLTFNLNEISKAQLEQLDVTGRRDVVSYYVPNDWKQIMVPSISDAPIQITDPEAKFLRIDFVRATMVELKSPTPISLYFPPNHASQLNPKDIHISNNEMVETLRGIKVIAKPLFVKGVSNLFVDIIKGSLDFVVIFPSKTSPDVLNWSPQFINPRELEDRYVSAMITDLNDEDTAEMQPRLRQEYLRNRFRNYMNRLQIYTKDQKLLELDITLKNKDITIKEKEEPEPQDQ